jgi:hypothetical protein
MYDISAEIGRLDIRSIFMLRDLRESSMLELTSRFVLEILPYLLSALIAAVVVPGFVYSTTHEPKAAVESNGPRLAMIHWDHAVLLSDSDKTTAAYR